MACPNPVTGVVEREDTPGWEPPPGTVGMPGGWDTVDQETKTSHIAGGAGGRPVIRGARASPGATREHDAMAFFLVTMTHPDGEGWGRHVGPHVRYLLGLIEAGKIRASGPVSGLGKRAGFILMTVDSREEAEALVAEDPFAIEGLIDELTILDWDPMFGAFSEDASRRSAAT